MKNDATIILTCKGICVKALVAVIVILLDDRNDVKYVRIFFKWDGMVSVLWIQLRMRPRNLNHRARGEGQRRNREISLIITTGTKSEDRRSPKYSIILCKCHDSLYSAGYSRF